LRNPDQAQKNRKAQLSLLPTWCLVEFLHAKGNGTKDNPWILKTPSGTSEYKAYKNEAADSPAIVVWVGKTELKYTQAA